MSDGGADLCCWLRNPECNPDRYSDTVRMLAHSLSKRVGPRHGSHKPCRAGSGLVPTARSHPPRRVAILGCPPRRVAARRGEVP